MSLPKTGSGCPNGVMNGPEEIRKEENARNTMNVKAKGDFLRTLRTIHGWLGIFVVPWVLIMGLTGFYMNHSKMVLSLFQQKEFSESQFEKFQPPTTITRDTARILAESVWPKQSIKKIWKKDYHGRSSFYVRKATGLVILSIPTGHYYLKTRYTRRTFSPKGELVHKKIYWGRIFKDLHETGWLGGGMGTLLADIISIALIFFGVSGSMMWTIPRVRRFFRSSEVS